VHTHFANRISNIVIYSSLYRGSLNSKKVDADVGKLYIVISDEVERRLRLEVVRRLGGKKGDLSAAIEEALKDWLNKKP
jgi:hypothetical protein